MSGKDVREAAVQFLTAHRAKRISIFGSYARGDAGFGSDLDVLAAVWDTVVRDLPKLKKRWSSSASGAQLASCALQGRSISSG